MNAEARVGEKSVCIIVTYWLSHCQDKKGSLSDVLVVIWARTISRLFHSYLDHNWEGTYDQEKEDQEVGQIFKDCHQHLT
jgi:hypothetical protein